jgi:hypothetical protein
VKVRKEVTNDDNDLMSLPNQFIKVNFYVEECSGMQIVGRKTKIKRFASLAKDEHSLL